MNERMANASKRYALMGEPIAGSPSPAMHNRAFCELGIDACYELRPTTADDVMNAVGEVLDGRWWGANITTPIKTLVAPHVPLWGAAARADAVNTLWRDGDAVVGALTDVDGVVLPLKDHGYAGGGRGLVIGAGGAARAAILALEELDTEVNLLVRRPQAAEQLLAHLRPRHSGAIFSFDRMAPLQDDLRDVAVIIQATPVGRGGETLELPWERFVGPVWALEMLYRPRVTGFLRAARGAGSNVIEGWEMLLAQGAAAFALWTGRAPPLDAMRAAIEESLADEDS